MSNQARPEDLARYTPSFLARRFAGDPTPLTAPTSTPLFAAVLFADITGFTSLSERLARRGPEGVEELTRVLNAYFGRLIDLITAHGGDVVKFAGDALLAFWPLMKADELPVVTQFAAQCGLEIQANLGAFAGAVGERLALRVGVGAGELFAVGVGGIFNRWEFVISGPGVVEATMSAAKAKPGSVVLGAGAWRILPADCRGTELSADHTQLDEVSHPLTLQPLCPPQLSDAAVPALLSFVPAAIHRRLAARQSGWLAELRRLTVLFVSLRDLSYLSGLVNAQTVMQTLQHGLYRYEGSVNKLSVDEKGVTLVAALGLPPLSHEDDELRGALAGLELQARLKELGWSCSIGVNSGQVFCGTIGNERRCEYTIIGDVVNLSARLMQAAHGGILCGATTYGAARQRLRWETLEPITVKGKAKPVAVFKPLGQLGPSQPAGPRIRPSMVGRAPEQQRLEEMLRRLAAERVGCVVLIEGEAGIGKSRLMANLMDSAVQLGVATMLGAAEAVQRSTPYYAWRPICRQLLGLDQSPADVAVRRQQVLNELAFDPGLRELAPLLDVVLALDFGDSPITAQMFGEVRVSNTNDVLVRLLKRRTATAPLQVILEDMHWLDSASWALARQVAQAVPSLLLVLVTRPLTDAVPREYTQLVAIPTTERFALSPLSAEESLVLVGQRLGVGRLPEPVAALLRAKAQGNPFFIEELAYALRDSGMIQVRGGQCLLAPDCDLDALPFPDTVQGVVTSRIDRLAPPEQLTLKVASVVGRNFATGILHDVCPIEEDRTSQARHLDILVRQQLVRLDAPEPEPAYSFKHVITQEVAYQLMPPTQRRTLHQSVAEWYERHYEADLSPYYPLLARHWSNTSQVTKALDYLERSGNNALRDYANEEAVAFFSQALDLDEQAGSPSAAFRRACWQRQLGEAYYHLGNMGKSLEHLQAALDLLGYPFPRSGWGMVLAGFWEFAKQGVHRLCPSWFLGRAGAGAATVLEAARAYERVAQVQYQNNAKVPTLHAAFRALNLSEAIGDSPELAHNYANAAIATGLLMMHGTARAHTERAQRIAEAVDQLPCTAYVAVVRSIYWATVGAWEEAERDATQAIGITERIGDRRRWYESVMTLAIARYRKGDLRGGAALGRDLYETGRRQAMPQAQVWGLSWRLWCLLALEPGSPEVRTLETTLTDCLATHADVPPADQILGRGLLALAYWRRGERQLARAAAEAAEQIVSQTNQISHYLLAGYAGLAEVYVGLWAGAAGEPELQREMQRRTWRLCKIFGQFALMYPVGKPRAQLIRGWYCWYSGRERRARAAWRAGLAAAERYRMPYEQGLAHYELGCHGPPDDAARLMHLARARELFQEVGAGCDLGRLEAVEMSRSAAS